MRNLSWPRLHFTFTHKSNNSWPQSALYDGAPTSYEWSLEYLPFNIWTQTSHPLHVLWCLKEKSLSHTAGNPQHQCKCLPPNLWHTMDYPSQWMKLGGKVARTPSTREAKWGRDLEDCVFWRWLFFGAMQDEARSSLAVQATQKGN